MKRIDQLSEPEIAALTEADLEKYIDIELMANGVLRPLKPVHREVQEVEVFCEDFWSVAFTKGCDYGTGFELEIAFDSEQDARDFVALRPYVIKSEWNFCGNRKFVIRLDPEEVKLVSCAYPTKTELFKHSEALTKSKQAQEENEKEERYYQKEVEMSEGNVSIAESFLSKAFKEADIEEAFTVWSSSTTVRPPRFEKSSEPEGATA